MNRIAIIGTGYVGTVAGACLAEAGNAVICVDSDARKVAALSGGDPVIYEPGLENLLKKNLKSGRIRFTDRIDEAVPVSEIVFLTVGTPPLPNGDADLRFLERAAEEIGRNITDYKIIVNKSTVPVGTHRKVREWVGRHAKAPFDVASNPEFLREGNAVEDFLRPERVVIGTEIDAVFERLRSVYSALRGLSGNGVRILRMDPVSSELTKYACNAFLATRISFMNELALLCERIGGDIEAIKGGMALDSRIGPQFLNAGIGYGGSCFPKDIRALLSAAARNGLGLKIVGAVEDVNDTQKRHLMTSIRRRFGKSLAGRTFALWGLAFKPNTDDLREAPSMVLIREIIAAGGKVRAHDPVANANARALIGEASGSIDFCDGANEALRGADALLIATEWDAFRAADLREVRKLLRQPVIFDGRNIFDPDAVTAAGLEYHSIGRIPSSPVAKLAESAKPAGVSASGNGSDIAPRALTA